MNLTNRDILKEVWKEIKFVMLPALFYYSLGLSLIALLTLLYHLVGYILPITFTLILFLVILFLYERALYLNAIKINSIFIVSGPNKVFKTLFKKYL